MNKFIENHFTPPIQIQGDRMIGLTSLEVYISVSNILEENIIFELYTDNFQSDLSFNELKDEVAEVLGVSDFTPEELEHEI